MKTKEELKVLRNEAEALNAKLAELTEDELAQIYDGLDIHTTTKNDVDHGGHQLY